MQIRYLTPGVGNCVPTEGEEGGIPNDRDFFRLFFTFWPNKKHTKLELLQRLFDASYAEQQRYALLQETLIGGQISQGCDAVCNLLQIAEGGLAPSGFDPLIFGLWAQRDSASPQRYCAKRESNPCRDLGRVSFYH